MSRASFTPVGRRAPPSTKRGAELTGERGQAPTAGIHWYAATAMRPTDDVLGFISETFHGADFTVMDRGVSGYTRTFTTIYGLRVFENPDRPEMGVHVIADGEAAEAMGHAKLQLIHFGLDMQPTRIDVALDHCPFEPHDLYTEWLRDNVRTRCKAPSNAKPDRIGVRAHTWMSSPAGDTFYMGSRQSTAFARCYDERGHTRFELELKGDRARAAAHVLFDPEAAFGIVAIGLVRDFVDYVDRESSANRRRCSLLPFWEAFIGSGDRIRLQMDEQPARSMDRTADWIWSQVAPSLALYEMWVEIADKTARDQLRRDLRQEGLRRLKQRHQALLSAAQLSLAPGRRAKMPDSVPSVWRQME